MPQGTVRQSGEQHVGSRQSSRLRIRVDANDALCSRCKQFQQSTLAAADVQEITKRMRHGQLDQGPMQRAILILRRFQPVETTKPAQKLDVLCELWLVFRQQFQQPSSPRGIATFGRDPVIDEMTVSKSSQQPSITQLLQMLRDARLTLTRHGGELGNAAFGDST